MTKETSLEKTKEKLSSLKTESLPGKQLFFFQEDPTNIKGLEAGDIRIIENEIEKTQKKLEGINQETEEECVDELTNFIRKFVNKEIKISIEKSVEKTGDKIDRYKGGRTFQKILGIGGSVRKKILLLTFLVSMGTLAGGLGIQKARGKGREMTSKEIEEISDKATKEILTREEVLKQGKISREQLEEYSVKKEGKKIVKAKSGKTEAYPWENRNESISEKKKEKIRAEINNYYKAIEPYNADLFIRYVEGKESGTLFALKELYKSGEPVSYKMFRVYSHACDRTQSTTIEEQEPEIRKIFFNIAGELYSGPFPYNKRDEILNAISIRNPSRSEIQPIYNALIEKKSPGVNVKKFVDKLQPYMTPEGPLSTQERDQLGSYGYIILKLEILNRLVKSEKDFNFFKKGIIEDLGVKLKQPDNKEYTPELKATITMLQNLTYNDFKKNKDFITSPPHNPQAFFKDYMDYINKYALTPEE